MTNLDDSWDDDLDGVDSPDGPHALFRTFPPTQTYPMCSDRFGNPLTHEEILMQGLLQGLDLDAYEDEDEDEDEDDDGLDAFGDLADFYDDDDRIEYEYPIRSRPGAMLCTAEEVHLHLVNLVGPERDGPRALWVIFLDPEDRVLPLVIPIGDLPTIVDRTRAATLAVTLRALVDDNSPGGCVAFGLVRRGGGDRGTFEAGWSAALREAMTGAGVRVRTVVAIGRDRSCVLPEPLA